MLQVEIAVKAGLVLLAVAIARSLLGVRRMCMLQKGFTMSNA